MKPSWLYNQSAVIPYRKNGEDFEVLLVTSRKRKRWVVPKGVIEPGLTPEESAVEEAYEEAGIRGIVLPGLVGEYDYEKWGGVCHVRVYLFEVDEILETWPESHFRERAWHSIGEAAEKVREPDLKRMIQSVPDRVS